ELTRAGRAVPVVHLVLIAGHELVVLADANAAAAADPRKPVQAEIGGVVACGPDAGARAVGEPVLARDVDPVAIVDERFGRVRVVELDELEPVGSVRLLVEEGRTTVRALPRDLRGLPTRVTGEEIVDQIDPAVADRRRREGTAGGNHD